LSAGATGPLRVVQCATGNIGTRSLREVVRHPSLEDVVALLELAATTLAVLWNAGVLGPRALRFAAGASRK
jgi:hypothetical protein